MTHNKKLYVAHPTSGAEFTLEDYMNLHNYTDKIGWVVCVSILDAWDNGVMKIHSTNDITPEDYAKLRTMIEEGTGCMTFASIQDYIKSLKD